MDSKDQRAPEGNSSPLSPVARRTPPARRRLVLGGAALLLVAGGVAFWWAVQGEKDTAPTAATPVPVPAAEGRRTLSFPPGAPQLSYLRIEPVKAEPVPLIEPIPGRLTYDDDVTARVFAPVSLRIVQPLAQIGDKVAAGTPLARVDVPDAADLARTQADLRAKAAAYERSKEMYAAEVLSKKDLDLAENDFRAAEAEVARASTRLRWLGAPAKNGGGQLLESPRAGVITERTISPGLEARPDATDPLYVVSDPTRLWALADLPEKDLSKVHAGEKVVLLADAWPGERFIGKVTAVADVLNPQTRRVQVRVAVPNPERKLKPEMFVRVAPSLSDKVLPRVPNTALVTEGLATYLFVETAPGTIERREVQLAFRGVDFSAVTKGLSAGERVVTVGAVLLNAELAGH